MAGDQRGHRRDGGARLPRRARRRSPGRGAARAPTARRARGIAPSTGTPAPSQACRSTCSWRGEPTRLRITPADAHTAGRRSKTRAAQRRCSGSGRGRRRPGPPGRPAVRRPGRWTRAAGVIACSSMRPSNRPITPSTTAMSAPAVPCRYSGPISSSATSTGSRLRPGPAGGQRVVAGVDEVGADLERRHPVPGRPQGAHQTGRDGGLAAARGRGGDDDGRVRCSPLDAPLALAAGVHRVLDLGHLGDQVGGLEQLLRGVAAGDDDVLAARAGRAASSTTSSTSTQPHFSG